MKLKEITPNVMVPNDEITVLERKRGGTLKLRDRHKEVVKQTRPEGCGVGKKISRRPTLDDYDNW